LQLPTWQLIVEQLPVPFAIVHGMPHAPQLVTVVKGSQPLAALPSQLPKFVLHPVSAQVPVLQLAVPLVRAQAVPQTAQLVLVFSGVSQPAALVQLPKPLAHV
jgi:hypothetical protein